MTTIITPPKKTNMIKQNNQVIFERLNKMEVITEYIKRIHESVKGLNLFRRNMIIYTDKNKLMIKVINTNLRI